MLDREILLVLVGGVIGAASSLATLLVSYWLEGLRLRRQWAREDQLQMRAKREELQASLRSGPSQGTAVEEQLND
jgi:hypothetical protein